MLYARYVWLVVMCMAALTLDIRFEYDGKSLTQFTTQTHTQTHTDILQNAIGLAFFLFNLKFCTLDLRTAFETAIRHLAGFLAECKIYTARLVIILAHFEWFQWNFDAYSNIVHCVHSMCNYFD